MSIGICYWVIARGVKAAGKIIVFTSLFPYVLFMIMFMRGIFLPGAMDGLRLLFQFKGNIVSPHVWLEAIIQVFYQLTLACSGIVHMSSMKPKNQPFVSGLYWILLSVLVCGMLCALNIFIYLGHFSSMIGVPIQEITLSGPEICFNIFPKALAILPFPRIWLFLFFVTMVLLGIDTMIGAMESIVCYLKD
jgi:solute carrier family 6 amino acid transporter-like protein 5/7/9/14